MRSGLVGVVTTIQRPTDSVRRLAPALSAHGAPLLIVGDEKGPMSYDVEGTELFSFADQLRAPFELARVLPARHYARKNLGYLRAMERGAACIYETDDDNHPLACWAPRSSRIEACPVAAGGWHNVYASFSGELIWPRGLPLDAVRGRPAAPRGPARFVEAPIQQGLADGSPDVDAVWRLVFERDVRFRADPSVVLEPGTWCPFNSQSTWWWPPAYALMYLPSLCSFRMTDIWRSFVAQRCLWALGHGVVFHAPEVEQDRNAHDLLRDFEQEVPGYCGNGRIAGLLDGLELAPGPERVGENLRRCYEALVGAGHVGTGELALVEAWIADVARVGR